MPPWWPEPLARATGAEARSALTSRNSLLALRRAIASRRPDLLKSWGGGCNAILARGGAIRDHRVTELTKLPERRVAHGVALADGSWVVNVHLTTEPKPRTRADGALALAAARRWAGESPLVFGGDFNLEHPGWPGLDHVAGHHVDHVLCSGLRAVAPPEVLDAGHLSDHRPLGVELVR